MYLLIRILQYYAGSQFNKFIHLLFRNLDGLLFGEFLEELTVELKKAVDAENKDDTMSLNSLLGHSREKEKEPPTPDEDEFLKLHDGNYLKAKEAEQEQEQAEKDKDSNSDKRTDV